ncbi:hypothetical protein COY95_01240 [Candidatus Woesearchaeota archaeon CG_4_10_14_0_8_um_filter_47_5]|nr:MAG: hypothetical protein COY95_01240 [Candidatus Woesearchaeota archaeon CG_4_10_14_0_8_um_filter_47_5]
MPVRFIQFRENGLIEVLHAFSLKTSNQLIIIEKMLAISAKIFHVRFPLFSEGRTKIFKQDLKTSRFPFELFLNYICCFLPYLFLCIARLLFKGALDKRIRMKT